MAANLQFWRRLVREPSERNPSIPTMQFFSTSSVKEAGWRASFSPLQRMLCDFCQVFHQR